MYIHNEEEPWTGEWFRKDISRRQGGGFVAHATEAEEQAETTFDLREKKVAFIELADLKEG